MRTHKTTYELTRSQVTTPSKVVQIFWQITHKYRSFFPQILDLGAGDGRFAIGAHYNSYEGVESDTSKRPLPHLPQTAMIQYMCAFEHHNNGYDACIGNPPYVRHHDLDATWRDVVASRLSEKVGIEINRKCNLYIYFLFLAILKSRQDGLVSAIVPYEWVSRPSAAPLRKYIKKNRWHVDIYRFSQPIFNGVLTTASISVIDKSNCDDQWNYYELAVDGTSTKMRQLTGSSYKILPYENRGKIWAMRGMSPGTQKVFTLTEGERIHAGLTYADVFPCVTSLRAIPGDLSHLTYSAFRKRFVEAEARCWLIRSHANDLSPRLQAYLDSVLKELHDTWTCNTRDPWYRYPLFDSPDLLVSTGFTKFGPKILINSVKAYAIGSVCGIYLERNISVSHLRNFLTDINFEKRVVPHAKQLKKIEIRQLNSVLKTYLEKEKRHV